MSTFQSICILPRSHVLPTAFLVIEELALIMYALITVTVTLTTFAYTKVIPAKAGIQEIMQYQPQLDPRLRGGDGGAVIVTVTKAPLTI